MAAVSIHQLAQCITCHAWSPDKSMIAICPNNTEVHIFKFSADKWEKAHVLYKHDQIISGIDWGVKSNKIVTVSHDRNSYVWNQEASEWVPTLVILRLNRAALCVQWSPKENKFAVGSGAKTVCICYYEQENNWWVSKIIRKKHNSSVTSVAWHPDNIFLATTSTDGKCRVFSTFIKGVDTRDKASSSSNDMKFGEQIAQLDLSITWAFGVKWSPSGNTLAYTGHNSTIYFVEDVVTSPCAQNVAFRDLPLRDVLFITERTVIGVGFDCNPMVFTKDGSGLWSFVRFLDERKKPSSSKYGSQVYLELTIYCTIRNPSTMLVFCTSFLSSPRKELMSTWDYEFYEMASFPGFSQNGASYIIPQLLKEGFLSIHPRKSFAEFSEAFGKLYGQSKYGGSSETLEPSKPRGGAHENCITCIVPLKKAGDAIVKCFSTSGLDGKVVTWDLSNSANFP